MNIIIFDDDKRIRQLCAKYIEESGRYSLSLSTDSYEEVMAYAKQNIEPSLYVLDIVIHGLIKGLTLGKEVKTINKLNLIVFITSFPQHILYDTASKVLAMNVILKSKQWFQTELLDTLCLAETILQTEKIFRCYNRADGYSIIPFEDIYFFERLKNSQKICLYHRKGITTFNRSLSEVIKLLDKNFVRCHQSYIVNTKVIRKMDGKKKQLDLEGGYICYFSILHKKELKKCLKLN